MSDFRIGGCRVVAASSAMCGRQVAGYRRRAIAIVVVFTTHDHQDNDHNQTNAGHDHRKAEPAGDTDVMEALRRQRELDPMEERSNTIEERSNRTQSKQAAAF